MKKLVCISIGLFALIAVNAQPVKMHGQLKVNGCQRKALDVKCQADIWDWAFGDVPWYSKFAVKKTIG